MLGKVAIVTSQQDCLLLVVEWFPDELTKRAWRDQWWPFELQGLDSRSIRQVDGSENATSSSDCVAQIWELNIFRRSNPTLRLEVGSESFYATTIVIWVDSGNNNPE